MKYQFNCTQCGAILEEADVDGLGGHTRTEDAGDGTPTPVHCGPVEVIIDYDKFLEKYDWMIK